MIATAIVALCIDFVCRDTVHTDRLERLMVTYLKRQSAARRLPQSGIRLTVMPPIKRRSE
jgi:hypothetical protein